MVPTIRDIGSKIKSVSPRAREKAFLLAVIILVALLAFALGRLSVLYGGAGEVKVVYPDAAGATP